VLNTREVPLGGVDKVLQGVVGMAYEPVNVGDSGGRAAVAGAMLQPDDTVKEVIEFVKALLKHDRIDLDKKKKGAVASPRGATDGKRSTATHAIESVGGKKVLTACPLLLRPPLKLREAFADQPALAFRIGHQRVGRTEGRFSRSSCDLLVVGQTCHIGFHFLESVRRIGYFYLDVLEVFVPRHRDGVQAAAGADGSRRHAQHGWYVPPVSEVHAKLERLHVQLFARGFNMGRILSDKAAMFERSCRHTKPQQGLLENLSARFYGASVVRKGDALLDGLEEGAQPRSLKNRHVLLHCLGRRKFHFEV